MIITSIQELRLIYPNHAFDSIDGMIGFIDNSEHGFLEDKLGTPLYNALCQWYNENPIARSNIADYDTGYWNRLLLMAQRVVGFDALGRSAGMQAISVNNAGINMGIANDYPKATKESIDDYRKTCFTEALKSCDNMLATLEQWTTEATVPSVAVSQQPSQSPATVPSVAVSQQPSQSPAAVPDASPSGPADERTTIVTLWRQSRYFYLAASMLIPSAVVLQQYLDFAESREKFIRMLPDIRFIQEEIIANAIGDEYLDHLIDIALHQAGDATPITTKSPVELRIIHQLRKVMVAWLGSRTSVIKYSKEEKIQFHDDGVRKLHDACQFVQQHQPDILIVLGATQQQLDDITAGEATINDLPASCQPFIASPLFVAPPPSTTSKEHRQCHSRPACCGNHAVKGTPTALWTPPIL